MKSGTLISIIAAASIAACPVFGQQGYGQGGFTNSGAYYPSNGMGSGSFTGSQFPQTSLNQILDQVEQSRGWQQTPMGGVQGMQSSQAGGYVPGTQMSPAPNTFGYGNNAYYRGGQVSTSMGSGNNASYGQMPFQNSNMMGARPTNGFAPFGGMRQPLESGNPFSKQNLLRIFLGGGSGSTGGFGGSSSSNPERDASITGQAQSLLQRANDQAAQAVSDEYQASKGSGNDQGTRQGCASSAQYHANDARAAAEQAESISYSGPSYAKDYAAQARAAANRAQASADRARYNASQN